jgi:hypothetical protein
MKISFIRESYGVYSFGSKRVAIRVEKDRIYIRIGGGWISLDEFLEKYSKQEQQRHERRESNSSVITQVN